MTLWTSQQKARCMLEPHCPPSAQKGSSGLPKVSPCGLAKGDCSFKCISKKPPNWHHTNFLLHLPRNPSGWLLSSDFCLYSSLQAFH